ncbi:MAG: hypothetical protein KIS73_23675 [Enhydrobacter sp.]|nr:hypothetical protein [Enhydrobacter sp.]
MIPELLLIVAMIAGAFVAEEFGYRLGRYYGPRDEAFTKQLGLVSNATFALVAFLVGFGFSGAATRYVDSLDLVVKEANALGTAYLRADTLQQPMRNELKQALRSYAADRLELLRSRDADTTARLLAKVGPQQNRLWEIAVRGTADNPPLMNVVLPPLNEVIDLHTTHLAAARRHIPIAIMTALLASAVISLALVSFGNGLVGRRFPVLNSVYGLTLVIALWMTIDLDHLRRGAIQVNVQPLIETYASFTP